MGLFVLERICLCGKEEQEWKWRVTWELQIDFVLIL